MRTPTWLTCLKHGKPKQHEGAIVMAPRIPLPEKTIPKLIKLLDAEFSKYVRRNYSADGLTVDCFTCGVNRKITEMHNGHYIPRTQSPTRHHESNCRPQCPGCNTFRSGMPHEFRRNLCLEIGDDAVLEMEEESRQAWKWNRYDLAEQIMYYRNELKEMT